MSPESTGSILSLVKTFDSVLAVYEGFCNLKQVKKFNGLVIVLFSQSCRRVIIEKWVGICSG